MMNYKIKLLSKREKSLTFIIIIVILIVSGCLMIYGVLEKPKPKPIIPAETDVMFTERNYL